MASPSSPKSDSHRPRPLHASRSFARVDPASPDPPARAQRASTIQNGTIPGFALSYESNLTRETREPRIHLDRFGNSVKDEEDHGPRKLPADFDELPIELASLADTFIDSLSAKVHATPPSIDKLSGLFQNFYAVAATHIGTHISALSSRQHRRDTSPAPSVSSLSSTASKIRAKAVSISSKDRPKGPPERRDSEQQMLTTEEIADRKHARRVLEQKRLALEEAVEQRVCEGIYDRIWRHRSTQDEAQDEKLRSKTAALSVVGIGLTDLGVDLGSECNDKTNAIGDKENEIREWLEDAREELIAMNDEKYPLGKLQHLKAAHKSIVDTLSHFHPSSSADEIMPMLIYTLITSRPEGMNVISNLYFIQRFRNESKIDGEAAYCLTNLEAAITFLETVDLASLRADEVPSGPPKPANIPNTPGMGKSELVGLAPLADSAPTTLPANTNPIISKPPSSPPSPNGLRPSIQTHNRRLSDLFQPPAVLGAAGDAVLNTADQGFKTIGSSLGDSYKFLIGKLKERQEDPSTQASDIIVPKTLDDARKLVCTPPPAEDEGSASGGSSLHSPEITERKRSDSGAKPSEDKVLSMIGGRKLARDSSTDSARSASSNKKVAFAEEAGEKTPSPLHTAAAVSANPAIVESMRNLGNSLNPMNRITAIGMMRGFGRATTPVPAASKAIPDSGVTDLTTSSADPATALPPKEVVKVAPPIKRFMEVQNPGELRISEVLELLRDYRRLGEALKDLGAV